MDENQKRDLTSFQKSFDGMVATNSAAYNSEWNRTYQTKLKDYSLEEIENIINSGSIEEQQKLSQTYFYKDGFYKRIIIHYATLLKYVGLLIPNPSFGKSLSTSHIAKRYYNATNFVEYMSLPTFFANCAIRAFTYGTYFGIIQSMDKKTFSVIDLPVGYCRSNFKDVAGNDVIEFNVRYFDTIPSEKSRDNALAAYPRFIEKAYRLFNKGKLSSSWVIVPSQMGICFPLFDGRPIFLSAIPSTIQYDKAVEIEQEKEMEEIRKIIVQKMPHLNDGRLVFEPDEALSMHNGSVKMLKGNKNISVLTTYADVDAISSKTTSDNHSDTLERMRNNTYSEIGVSSQLFSSTGSTTLEASLKNDLALVMYLANKFSNFVTYIINSNFGNGNISFKYQILPVSYYNEDKYIDNAFKLASSGYSLLLPSIAMGISQRDIGNIKDLENDVLNLGEKLIPLASSYTQGADSEKNGAPKKEQEEKAEQTIKNEESLDNQTGGSE